MERSKIVGIGNSELVIPPLRGLDDFLLESARFQIPNFKDLDKWGNRVVNNLFYYQTNYFFMSVIIFLIVGLIHPVKMLVGAVSMSVALGLFAYASCEGRAIHQTKKDYPALGVILILIGSSFLAYTVGSLLVFLIGILLPFSVTFIHASMRLRNIRNKLVNKMEELGLKRTPMSIFLEQLGYPMQTVGIPKSRIKQELHEFVADSAKGFSFKRGGYTRLSDS
ncbi:PRA1 family protein 3 [Neodiprion lecontei]|uniref:PRA1 family protein n=1 Tax=Neodiprion lecontei TaxID=441921 RepID=A0A6J0CEZ8_NEOLC|nr:PRA1 family protein 3 [Neodiprion lecontei]